MMRFSFYFYQPTNGQFKNSSLKKLLMKFKKFFD